MNDKREVYKKGHVLIENDKIINIGHFPLPDDCDEIMDCEGKTIMPSFVNTHTHTSQQLARGLADDVPLLTWLHDRICHMRAI